MLAPTEGEIMIAFENQKSGILRGDCRNNTEFYVIPSTASDCGNCTANNSCICDMDSCPKATHHWYDGYKVANPTKPDPTPDFWNQWYRYWGRNWKSNIINQACGKEAVNDRYELLKQDAYARLSRDIYNKTYNVTVMLESIYNISQIGLPEGTFGIYFNKGEYPRPNCPKCNAFSICHNTTGIKMVNYADEV